MVAPLAVPAAVKVGATVLQVGAMLWSAFTGNRAAAQRQRAADRMAKDAIDRGEEEANIFAERLRAMLGRQRAVMGASGVALNQGSAMQVQADTQRIGNRDMATIRRNAQREAFGIRKGGQAQATGMRNTAFADAMQGVSTLIGAAADPWDRWTGRQRANAAIGQSAVSPEWY